MKDPLLFTVVAVLAAVLIVDSHAQRMPQDNWYLENEWVVGEGAPNYDTDIAAGPDGNVYVPIGDQLRIYGPTGGLQRAFTYSGANKLRVATNGYIYAALGGSLTIYSPTGAVVATWNLPFEVDSLAPAENGVYVVSGTRVPRIFPGIYLFDLSGNVITNWGELGILDGQFEEGYYPAVAHWPGGPVYVAESYTKINVYDQSGNYLHKLGLSLDTALGRIIAINEAALFHNSFGIIQLYSQDGTEMGGFSIAEESYISGPNNIVIFSPRSSVRAPSGDIFTAGFRKLSENADSLFVIRRYRSTYRTVDVNNSPPQPFVTSLGQRPGTTYMDIEYVVEDVDSTNITAASVAFVDGSYNLNKLLKMNTLVEGTSSNLGANVAANTMHRLVWNAGADWSTNFANVKVAILANDGQPLLGNSFITLPSDGTNAALTISQSPVKDDDVLSIWCWLIATNDPAINLSSGVVYGVGGPYDGQALASGTATTSNGWSFLYERLNLRAATTSEVARARVGPAGVVNITESRNSVGPGRWPAAVNEYGFDTGTGGTWVVPNSP